MTQVYCKWVLWGRHLIIYFVTLQLDCIMVCDFNLLLALYLLHLFNFLTMSNVLNVFYFNNITTQRGSAAPPIEQCTTCCTKFHCQFCVTSIFKHISLGQIESHQNSLQKRCFSWRYECIHLGTWNELKCQFKRLDKQ